MKHLWILLLSIPAWGNLCHQWSDPQVVALHNKKLVNEASGIAVSRKNTFHWFHANDHQDDNQFFVSRQGKNFRTVAITNFRSVDVEDLTTGPCFQRDTCLFIGDIGDNLKVRGKQAYPIQIAAIVDRARWSLSVEAKKVVTLSYPNGPQDAEGLAVHPNGDIFIVSREREVPTAAVQIYRLPKEIWTTSDKTSAVLERVGEIHLQTLIPDLKPKAYLVTSMDIHPKGQHFILLTTGFALEVNVDLSKRLPSSKTLKKQQLFSKIPIKKLKQPEGITYSSGGRGILYDTEFGGKKKAPIMEQHCVKTVLSPKNSR